MSLKRLSGCETGRRYGLDCSFTSFTESCETSAGGGDSEGEEEGEEEEEEEGGEDSGDSSGATGFYDLSSSGTLSFGTTVVAGLLIASMGILF